jgi:hypothetical protein
LSAPTATDNLREVTPWQRPGHLDVVTNAENTRRRLPRGSSYTSGQVSMSNVDPDKTHERAVECAACGHQRGVHDDSMQLCMGTAEALQHEPLSKRCACQEFVEPGQSQAASANP